MDIPSASRSQPAASSFTRAAEDAAQWVVQGAAGRERAAGHLLRHCGVRLIRFMQSHGRVPEAEAEELASDAVLAFVTKPLPQACRPDVWLWTIARNLLVSWARARHAQKRGGDVAGGMELAFDEEDFTALLETSHDHVELPAWVRDCVQKAAAVLQQEKPERAMVLHMVVEQWSDDEIAVYFGADPSAPTAKQCAAARDRRYRARQEARSYFEHCKD